MNPRAEEIISESSWFSRGLIALVILLLALPLLAGVGSGLTSESAWDGTQVWDQPLWLQIWLLGILFPTFLSSLFFVRGSNEARLAIGGFIVSHVPMWLSLFDTTVGDMIVFLMTSHEMDHLGQIAAWRRAMGLGAAE